MEIILWDTLYKEMIYDVQFRRDDRTFEQFLDSRYALMQFIGLHDVNDKEVYEGDIVRMDGFNHPVGIITYQPPDYNLVSILTGNAHSLHGGELTIIGNIYENKELLSNP